MIWSEHAQSRESLELGASFAREIEAYCNCCLREGCSITRGGGGNKNEISLLSVKAGSVTYQRFFHSFQKSGFSLKLCT